MPGAITRLAPTPSGFLHEGNAVNFLLVSALAHRAGASVVLRIDDTDSRRYRTEYVEDIFAVLDWLQIDWHSGPRSPADFERDFSQRHRTDYYRSALDGAVAQGLEVFACRCSRSQVRAAGVSGCVGDCRRADFPLVPGESALRADTPTGDVVLWRRDDLPAYHLVSIIEDRDCGTTHVVRGEDLRPSTDIQVHLAPHLGATRFAEATFVHHRLVLGQDGTKLSKSQLAAGPLERSEETLDRIRALASAL